MQALLLLNLIIPFVMLLLGFLLEKYPAKDMRSGDGYNTRASRLSPERWAYAQQIAPQQFCAVGAVLTATELLLCGAALLLRIEPIFAVIAGLVMGFVFVVIAFYRTDKRINAAFDW